MFRNLSFELRAGEIVLVDVEGEGPTATFTFVGTPRTVLPDVPPVEAATSAE